VLCLPEYLFRIIGNFELGNGFISVDGNQTITAVLIKLAGADLAAFLQPG
jgi:hypothetical protein